MGSVVVLNLKTASSDSCILWHFPQTFANAEQIECRRVKTHLTLHLPVQSSLSTRVSPIPHITSFPPLCPDPYQLPRVIVQRAGEPWFLKALNPATSRLDYKYL